MKRLEHPFPPVAARGSQIMVLGMFPSEGSVRGGGYCGHPRNQFWPIMARILETPWLADPPGWDLRYMCLRLHLIALWDVVATCKRDGPSADAKISDVEAQPVAVLLEVLPDVRGVILNGRTAGDLFVREVLPTLDGRELRVVVAPSTSPRLAVPLEAKLFAWRRAFMEVGTDG